MIFGFNTDIAQGDTVYHVQSEIRQVERLLETQVFVRGRCIGKRTVPFGDGGVPSEREIQETLKLQHRQVLDAIREGWLESLLSEPEFKLEFLSAQAQPEDKLMALRFRVSAPARIFASLDAPGYPTACVQAESGNDGIVEFSLPLDAAADPDASFVVEANTGTRTATQRFRLRRK